MKLLQKLRLWLRTSDHVHLREHRIYRMSDLVDLIDRFLDGALEYEWEWDDFVSWEHTNPNIEAVRCKINEIPDLYHPDLRNRRMAVEVLIAERNRAAALIGLSERAYGPQAFPPELRELEK